MNKLYAILYSLIFLLALMGRTLECFFTAAIESRLVNWSFFAEVFKHNWNDTAQYTSVDEHLERVKTLWEK